MQDLKLTPEQMLEFNDMKKANEELYNKVTKKFRKEVRALGLMVTMVLGNLFVTTFMN